MRPVVFSLLTVLAFLFLGSEASAACGSEYFAGVADRLSSIEARTVRSYDEALANDRALSALFVSSDAPVRLAVEHPCAGDTSSILARDLARARTLELWGEMLALREIEAPVYPTPYRPACANADVRSWQVSFIAAWLGREQGTPLVGADALRRALERDQIFAHVRALALERARRLRITVVSTNASDGAAWLAANLHARALDIASANARCGPAVPLWALVPGEEAAATTRAQFARLP